MKSLIIMMVVAATAIPFAAVGAPAATDSKDNPTSTVDPSLKHNSAGAHPASPGTTGAMNSAGGGSFTADKSKASPVDKDR